ncbi:MAG: ATP-dependent DNA helicase RecG [Phycisphaerales bacterium]|nr:ATP-dependent DNA helicase RecG [Phycisphaerales bacterium]
MSHNRSASTPHLADRSGGSAPRLDMAIQYLRGVGPKRAAAFAELGVRTVGDLLEYLPFRYEDDAGDCPVQDLRPGMFATVRGQITRFGGQYPHATATLHDETGAVTLRWFNRSPRGAGVYRDGYVSATGKVQEFNGGLEIIQPRVRQFANEKALFAERFEGRRVGVYRATAELKAPVIRATIESVLSHADLAIDDPLPPAIRKELDLPPRATALREAHQPSDQARLEHARRRLAFDEFFLLELGMALKRRSIRGEPRGQALKVTGAIDERIRARLPFRLTPSQDKVIAEITSDLEQAYPMTRLLQGDVGSGKTVVAVYAALVAIANKRQAAIMAPTEILAAQHFANIERYLADSRVNYRLLRGGMSKRDRAELLGAIESGEIDLVVGTQALIQKDVGFRDLALVVVDEQHKFGVLQRHTFRTKAARTPHYLVMTATPIPRTLAMTVFGDLDVSTIRQSPPGRGVTTTRVLPSVALERTLLDLRPRLEAGEQAYFVCPVIGESEEETAKAAPAPRRTKTPPPLAPKLRSAIDEFERLRKGPWRDLPLGLLHGGMSQEDKDATLARFARGEIRGLISTTVVEVGVDVPNATIMVVQHAERFGLSQLHQLRGRVGRGGSDGLCLLVRHARGAKAKERLQVMCETTDGFRIAERDLAFRGPGELLGTRQHGLPEFRVADLMTDFELLELARDAAFALVQRDPKLTAPEHRPLRAALRARLGRGASLMDTA